MLRKGSNQYQNKYKYKFWLPVAIILLFCILVAFLGYYSKPQELISPIPRGYAPKVYATEPTPIVVLVYDKQSGDPIIDEISRIFKDEGTKVVAKAIMCFYGESKLRIDAVNVNTDGSRDRGIAQINDKWHSDISDKDAFDYKKSIKKAYQLYLQRGKNFKAWYAPECK